MTRHVSLARARRYLATARAHAAPAVTARADLYNAIGWAIDAQAAPRNSYLAREGARLAREAQTLLNA